MQAYDASVEGTQLAKVQRLQYNAAAYAGRYEGPCTSELNRENANFWRCYANLLLEYTAKLSRALFYSMDIAYHHCLLTSRQSTSSWFAIP